MAKYLLLWELDSARIPEDPSVRKEHWRGLQDAVVKHLEAGQMKDWGLCVGEMTGFCIIEGTEADVGKVTRGYVPCVSFDVKQVITIQQAIQNVEDMDAGLPG
jgi:hypothetical protein